MKFVYQPHCESVVIQSRRPYDWAALQGGTQAAKTGSTVGQLHSVFNAYAVPALCKQDTPDSKVLEDDLP